MRTLGLCALLMLASGSAGAGRRLLAWPYDTETLPQRGVEIEQWIWERADVDEAEIAAWLWFAPVVGLTDQLEIALPIEWEWIYGLPTQFESYGLDLRWRISPVDPQAAWPVVPLLRVGVKRHLANARNGVGLELDAVASSDVANIAHFVIDAGVKDLIQGGEHTVTLDFFAGGTVHLGAGLRLGATLWAEIVPAAPTDGPEEGLAFIALGPDVSFSFGRFWVTAGMPVSLYRGSGPQPRLQPRLTWGILF